MQTPQTTGPLSPLAPFDVRPSYVSPGGMRPGRRFPRVLDDTLGEIARTE